MSRAMVESTAIGRAMDTCWRVTTLDGIRGGGRRGCKGVRTSAPVGVGSAGCKERVNTSGPTPGLKAFEMGRADFHCWCELREAVARAHTSVGRVGNNNVDGVV